MDGARRALVGGEGGRERGRGGPEAPTDAPVGGGALGPDGVWGTLGSFVLVSWRWRRAVACAIAYRASKAGSTVAAALWARRRPPRSPRKLWELTRAKGWGRD